MDKLALAHRNRQVAAALHTRSAKEDLRSLLLKLIARLPVAQIPGSHNRILIIRPDHLGDVLLTLPAIRALRRANPGAEIHALVGSWSADVLAPITEVDLVLTLDFPGFSRTSDSSLISPYVLAFQTAQNLRRIGYDRVYILRRDHWWGALVAFLGGIPHRYGYDLPDMGLFLTHSIAHQPAHAVLENLRLVSAEWTQDHGDTSTTSYPVAEDARLDIRDQLRDKGSDLRQPYFVIHVGSGAEVKNWQDKKWAKVADALADGLNGTAILTGSKGEQESAQRIAALMKHPAQVLAGQTDMRQLAALLSEASLVLGPDSGPLHLAAAVGAPTVALFGPADPEEFCPWGDAETHRVVTSEIGCRPCRVLDWMGDDLSFHPCVREISVTQVIDAAWRAINAAASQE